MSETRQLRQAFGLTLVALLLGACRHEIVDPPCISNTYGPGSQIGANADIGCDNTFGANSLIGNDAIIGNDNSFGSSVHFGNNATG